MSKPTRFAFSELKIDQQFVRHASHDHISTTILKTSTLLGRELDMTAVRKASRGWRTGMRFAGLDSVSFRGYLAYMLTDADLPGLTKREQLLLDTLVRGYRRKFPKDKFKALPKRLQETYRRRCILLRLSVVLHLSRSKDRLPAITFSAEQKIVVLEFLEGWLDHHPLTRADLEQEAEYPITADYKLRFK